MALNVREGNVFSLFVIQTLTLFLFLCRRCFILKFSLNVIIDSSAALCVSAQ
jgi:hypothetical protein